MLNADLGDYISYTNGEISEVRCKGCGVPIRKLISNGSMGAVQHINGQVVVRERLILAALPHYREVLIQLEDGSKHVTCLCEACVSKLADPAQAQAIYQKDVDQFEKEGASYTPAQRNRAVTGVLKVAPYIGM